MILIDNIFSKFPILETERLLLTIPDIEKHASHLHKILNEPDIKENYLNPLEKIELLSDVQQYIWNCHEHFRNKKSITWVIIEKSTNTIIGIRDLYFDSNNGPVEGQGCISKDYRRKGYSKECYSCFFNYFIHYGVNEYSAKSNGKSIAPIKLLYNLGFKTIDVSYIHPSFLNKFYSGWLLEFKKNLNDPDQEMFHFLSKNVGKKINFFVIALLRPYEIILTNKQLFFEINLKAFYPIQRVHREFTFWYDKKVVIDPNNSIEEIPFILNDEIMNMYKYFIENLSKQTIPDK